MAKFITIFSQKEKDKCYTEKEAETKDVKIQRKGLPDSHKSSRLGGL